MQTGTNVTPVPIGVPPTAVTGSPVYTAPTYPYYGGYYPYSGYIPYGYNYYYPLVGYGAQGYYSPYPSYPTIPYPYGYGLPTPYQGASGYYRQQARTSTRRTAARTRSTAKAPRASDSVAAGSREQNRAVEHAEEIMSQRALREGKVVQLDPQQIRVRFTAGGHDEEHAVPVKDVFFFRKDGGMVTAASAPELLQSGDSVLFPDPLAVPRQEVAGQRSESRKPVAKPTTRNGGNASSRKKQPVSSR